MACRQFNVFGMVCTAGEAACRTRRHDVLTLIRDYADESFDVLLPFCGIKRSGERKCMSRSGELHRLVKVPQEYDRPKLAEPMQSFSAYPEAIRGALAAPDKYPGSGWATRRGVNRFVVGFEGGDHYFSGHPMPSIQGGRTVASMFKLPDRSP